LDAKGKDYVSAISSYGSRSIIYSIGLRILFACRSPPAAVSIAAMKVAYVQIDPIFGCKVANIEKAIYLMETNPADLYVLPELFATGYLILTKNEADELAESPADGLTIRLLSNFAADRNCAVVFGFAERGEDEFYNSSAFIDQSGLRSIYRKIHLFATEKLVFSSGRSLPNAIEYKGMRLGMMICFDWIFPEIARNLAVKGADLICHPANLVLPYCQAAMVTRSIENHIFTLTCNRIGWESRKGQECRFTGGSQITDPWGNVLQRAATDKEEVFVADINYVDARDKRINKYNDLLLDRRPDLYNLSGE